jgi:hypothetical protein
MAEEEATREPDWPVCGRGDCIGVLVEGQEACLAHLGLCARKLALAALAPGADLDLRGMPIDAELLQQVLAALRPGDGPAKVGDVRFDRAQFSGIAVSEGVWFAALTRGSTTPPCCAFAMPRPCCIGRCSPNHLPSCSLRTPSSRVTSYRRRPSTKVRSHGQRGVARHDRGCCRCTGLMWRR